MKTKIKDDGIKLRGFFRIHIQNADGKIVGDSGWKSNTITNVGFEQYLCALLGNTTGSKQIAYVAIGTGTAPNATHTTLNGEVGASTKRKGVTVAVSANSKTVRFTATFGSTDEFLAGQSTLQNIGLFNNNDTDGALFAGSTFPTSSCDSNQNVNVTYDIGFS